MATTAVSIPGLQFFYWTSLNYCCPRGATYTGLCGICRLMPVCTRKRKRFSVLGCLMRGRISTICVMRGHHPTTSLLSLRGSVGVSNLNQCAGLLKVTNAPKCSGCSFSVADKGCHIFNSATGSLELCQYFLQLHNKPAPALPGERPYCLQLLNKKTLLRCQEGTPSGGEMDQAWALDIGKQIYLYPKT